MVKILQDIGLITSKFSPGNLRSMPLWLFFCSNFHLPSFLKLAVWKPATNVSTKTKILKIFGTTNSIEIKASGVVKVGYDMSKMVINVDNDSSKIYIKLPEIQLNDNYVIWDTVTCSESNNLSRHSCFLAYFFKCH